MSAAADHREWLTMHEAAEALGVTTRTIRRMIRIGVLRAGGTPGKVLIHRDDLNVAVRSRRHGSGG
jgi:excisionase family DNA binding protein